MQPGRCAAPARHAATAWATSAASGERTRRQKRHEVGDTWGGCDCDAVGMAGADAIDELLKEVERLETERTIMLIKMHGDCGVCVCRDQIGGICSECLMNEAHPHWVYEGSRLP